MWNKFPDTSGLVKMTGCNAKITDIEGKIPSITCLAINATLTAVGNKIPDVISLVKKNRLCCKNYWNWKQNYWS